MEACLHWIRKKPCKLRSRRKFVTKADTRAEWVMVIILHWYLNIYLTICFFFANFETVQNCCLLKFPAITLFGNLPRSLEGPGCHGNQAPASGALFCQISASVGEIEIWIWIALATVFRLTHYLINIDDIFVWL